MAGKNNKKQVYSNVIESMKDLGSSASEQVKSQVKEMPFDAMEQIFGTRPKTYSGEIQKGQSLSMKEVLSGKTEEKNKLNKQIMYEKRILEEERVRIEKRTNELRVQLSMIQREIISISSQKNGLSDLAKETKIAAMQVTVEPGLYHKHFFDWLLREIKKMKHKIEKASVWLHASNKRAQKKNAWGSNYKKHGAKYLLSSEHYLTRSAG